VRPARRVAAGDEYLCTSTIVLCTESVEQPPLKLFGVRCAKDLLGLRGDSVHDSPISVRMSTSLITITRGSILRHAGCQEAVAHDRPLRHPSQVYFGSFKCSQGSAGAKGSEGGQWSVAKRRFEDLIPIFGPTVGVPQGIRSEEIEI
jgi:hypothetical protein